MTEAPPPPPEISVIAPHLNQPEHLAAFLASLYAQDFDMRRAEVIIVDNGSRTLPEAVVAPYPAVRLVSEAAPGPGPGAQPRRGAQPGADPGLRRRRLPGGARLAAGDPRPLRRRPRSRGARRRHPGLSGRPAPPGAGRGLRGGLRLPPAALHRDARAIRSPPTSRCAGRSSTRSAASAASASPRTTTGAGAPARSASPRSTPPRSGSSTRPARRSPRSTPNGTG